VHFESLLHGSEQFISALAEEILGRSDVIVNDVTILLQGCVKLAEVQLQ
jgi:hypothetical protein